MLECVVNISEGRDGRRLALIAGAGSDALLDVHRDAHHNRAVLTLGASESPLISAVHAVADAAVACLDLARHEGVHPRIGVVDVVPFVDLDNPWAPATPLSLRARDEFATWAGRHLGLPCFTYGPHLSLPDLRRRAWRDLAPDTGPSRPHPTAGAAAVGARGALVAYNLWLAGGSDAAGPEMAAGPGVVTPTSGLALARRVAAAARRPGLRTLGLRVGSRLQVSCNLIDPRRLGPAEVFDLIASMAEAEGAQVTGAELVGLVPKAVLDAIPEQRWRELDLSADRTIESRMPAARATRRGRDTTARR